MFGLVRLQIVETGDVVIIGVGLTVTVIVYGTPVQVAPVEVGVTMY